MLTNTVPKLRFPGLSDGWQVKKLGDIVDSIGGTALEKYLSPSGSHKVISIGNYSTDGRYIDNGQRITATDKTLKKLLKRGDLAMVLNDKTATGDIIGSTILIDKDDTYIYNQRTERIIARDEVYPVYLWLQLNSPAFRKRIFSISQGGTQIYVNFTAVKKIPLMVPSKLEQRKIVNFLTAVDDKISILRQTVETLKAYKNSVTQKVFSQQIRFTHPDGSHYPEWARKKLGEISVIKTGKKDANIAKSDGEYRFYTCSRDYLHTDVYSFEGEAILVAGNADVGLCHYYNGKFEAYQRTYVLQNFKTDGKYLYKYLSHFFRQYALGLMQSSAMTYITLGTLENFTVPLPSEEEQQKIATFLTALDQKITLTTQQLEKTKEFKKGLLQRMFV